MSYITYKIVDGELLINPIDKPKADIALFLDADYAEGDYIDPDLFNEV